MWLKKRKVLTPNVFRLVKIVIAQVLVLIIHHGRTTSLENACSSLTICSNPAGARVLSLGKGSGAATAVAGYEVGGSWCHLLR